MTTVDVTRLINDVDPFELSRSVAEAGKDAGPTSWRNATTEATARPVLAPEEREAVRDYFKGYGAWEAEEIAAWSNEELDALVLQEAAHRLREVQDLCPGDGLANVDWEEAERLAGQGTVSGSLWPDAAGTLWIDLCD